MANQNMSNFIQSSQASNYAKLPQNMSNIIQNSQTSNYARQNSDAKQIKESSVDAKADDFINKFKKQLELQRFQPEPSPMSSKIGEDDDEGPTMEEIYTIVKQGNQVSQNSDTKPSGCEIPIKLPQKMKKSAFNHFHFQPQNQSKTDNENVGVAGKKATPVKKVEKKRESVVAVTNNASIKEEREDEAVVESSSVDAKADDFINEFKKQLQMQRNDSILRHKNLISRFLATMPEPEPSPVSSEIEEEDDDDGGSTSKKTYNRITPGLVLHDKPNSNSNTKPSGDNSNNGDNNVGFAVKNVTVVEEEERESVVNASIKEEGEDERVEVESSVDAKADDFSNKFKKQLLQLNDSILRSKNMIPTISATTDHKLGQMIDQDSRLAHFQKTANFIASGYSWTGIEDLKQRRSSFISDLESVNTEANDPEKARTVLTALKPHKTLTKLTINNNWGTSLPQWVVKFAFYCLRTLQLNNCSNCISLPSLGELPSLVYLSIKNFSRLEIVGPEFYGETLSQFTPFGTLKILHFEDLPKWQTWISGECESWAFPNLQELSLIECFRLVGEVPAGLLSLRKLEILDCEQLDIKLPQLPQLKTLKLQNCELVNLATLANLSSLSSLDASFEGENKTFVPNLEDFTSLSYLRIAGLHNLCTFNKLKFPSTLDTLFISQPVDVLTSSLSSFYDSVELLPSLHVLRFMPSSLTSLSIGGFKDLDLPQHSYMSLQYLSIHDCYLSESLHFPLGDFLMLKYLEIKNCFHLESFDITSATRHEICLPCLNELSIDNCPDLLSFPREGFAAPNLRTLSITNCKNLLSLPEGMHTCMTTSLLSLSLKDCPDLDAFPKGFLPSSLQTLRITYCKQLTSNWKQWKFQQLVSLTRLEIQGCEEVECFPPHGWLPASLTTLVIAHFPALVFLIGKALQQLTSLQELEIVYCQELLSLPKEGMPPSLKYLGIYFCPLLKKRCQRDNGEDWPKISHLPRVTIDFQEI